MTAAGAPPPAPLDLRIGPEVESIATAQEALGALVEAAGLPPLVARRAELVLEEIALNALRHGGAPEVLLHAAIEGQECRLRFEDRGTPFDPVTAAAPAPEPGVEAIGGNGVVLVRRLASALRYARLEDGVNRLDVALRPG